MINSPAKNDNAYPDIMSLSTLKPELDNTHSVATYKVLPLDFLHMKSMPTLDSVDIDHMVPDVTSAVPESRCIWKYVHFFVWLFPLLCSSFLTPIS